MDHQSDEALVNLLKSGNAQSHAELYRRYADGVFAYCARILARSDAAEDATQDTFMKMSAQIGSLTQPESFRSWLFRIARNVCLMMLRKSRSLELLDTEPIEEYESLISSFLDDELGGQEEEELCAHLETCMTCRSYLKKLFELRRQLVRGKPARTALPSGTGTQITRSPDPLVRAWQQRIPLPLAASWVFLMLLGGWLLVLNLFTGDTAAADRPSEISQPMTSQSEYFPPLTPR